MSPVSINGVDKQGVWINGVQVKQALNAANDTVDKGVYDPTTLSTVDADLAPANIKSGVTIFGKAGSADVRDISDADAAVGDVKDPKTFYAVGGARKTGTMATVALAAGANAYPAGYHAGEASLTAVDAQLAAGNIKDGVEIFGVTGTLVGAPVFGDVVRSAASPSTETTGIGGDSSKIWHCDATTNKIYELKTSDLSVSRSAASPSNGPYGIGGDWAMLYLCDRDADKVYQLGTV